MNIKKAIGVVAALLLAFVLHEMGHFAEMSERMIPVKEFSVGITVPLLQKEIDGITYTLRALPLMAYVAPADEGIKMQKVLHRPDHLAIGFAGVKNNFLSGVAVYLTVLLFYRKTAAVSLARACREVAAFVKRLALISCSGLIGLLSFGTIAIPAEPLITVPAQVPHPVRFFLSVSFCLVLLNLLPISFTDGGKMASATLSLWLDENAIKNIQVVSALYIFPAFLGWGFRQITLVRK